MERIRQAYVYFAADTRAGVVKIGYTNNLKRRLVQLKKKSGLSLFYHKTIKYECELSAMKAEKAFHEIFQQHNIRGEWFNYARPIVCFTMST